MSNFSSSASEVDASVWRAVAGGSVEIPSLHSYVYYFPEGHLEHSPSSSASVHNYNFTLKRPLIPCQVLSICFLSNPSSDQAYVKILLQPLGPRHKNNANDDDGNQNDVVLFAKILTPSDANNGGGFSVPRFCADMIFPRLDFAADPPVQNLTLKDTHSNAWEFRHIYRGTPRRHLLTTGWSKFVNAKRLVAGDSVVFMKKKSTNELFVGIRRAQNFGGGDDGRDGGEALEAIENAAKGMAFEVVYYPKVGLPDFVVKAEKVKDALRMCWRAGMRVRMAVETDDSSRMTWFQGTIAAAASPDSGPWCGSPWRMLQVTWDEPESLQNVNRVSPWQVEYVPPSSLLDSEFPPSKKFKVLQNPGMLPDGDGEYCFPITEFTRSMAGHLNSEVFNCSPFPVGMQGARRDRICMTGLSNTNSDKFNQTLNELSKNDIEPELKTISTVLSIGSSYSGNLSPGSQSSVHFCGNDLLGQLGHSCSTNIGVSSFRLFGKIIQMSEPEGGSKHNASCTDGEQNATYKEAIVINPQPNPSPRQQQCFGKLADQF